MYLGLQDDYKFNWLQPTFKIYKIVLLLNGMRCLHYSSESALAGEAVGKGRWVFIELHEADSASPSSFRSKIKHLPFSLSDAWTALHKLNFPWGVNWPGLKLGQQIIAVASSEYDKTMSLYSVQLHYNPNYNPILGLFLWMYMNINLYEVLKGFSLCLML